LATAFFKPIAKPLISEKGVSVSGKTNRQVARVSLSLDSQASDRQKALFIPAGL
jgi:hypothetical protein